MFPSLRELNPPVSNHEGPYLKARRFRNVKPPSRRSPLFDGQPRSNNGIHRHHASRSASNKERMLPKRALASAASDSDLSRCGGGSEDGSYEEVVPLSSNKFSPTTFFKKIDSNVKNSEADALKRRKRSIPIHNTRTVWNADVLVGSDAKEMLSPSTQQQRLAVQLKRVEDAKEKIIKRDLQSLRQSKNITLNGGEATLVIRDHKKMPPVGFIKVSPDKMTQTGRDLYLGKSFEKSTHDVTPLVNSSETTSKPVENGDDKVDEVKQTQDETIKVPTAAVDNPDDDNDRDESSTRMPKAKKKENLKKRTTVAVREKRAKARERRRNHIQEAEPTGEASNSEKQQPKSQPVVSSSESDADVRNRNREGSVKSGDKKTIAAAQLARQPPRLRKLLKKKMEAAQQQGDTQNADPPKPVRVTVREVSDLIAFVDLETKTHVKKFFSDSNVNPDSNVDFATLSQLLPSTLNEDMLKYLRTLYDYFRLLTTCSIKESSVLAAVAKRLGSKKSLLGKVRLKRPVDEVSPLDVKEFMVKFSSYELCGQVTSSKLLELLTSSAPSPARVILLEDNMETYLCKDNPRLLHKLDFFAYLPYLLSL
ncbi:uncharacterized protein LOC134182146 isoform X2 [Corticium candelabrum]|uniref:uncharacterized protein LOC134182146 isoform X2 n=1 Tax=Corticium candelabrum TaxID=121492 RepID=UPI002E252F86|nr:uncharacterized protein LOC134182146 isoform X2 [Corticium candelabrum]